MLKKSIAVLCIIVFLAIPISTLKYDFVSHYPITFTIVLALCAIVLSRLYHRKKDT